MNIDFKEIIWYRIPVDSTLIDKEKVLKAMKEKEVTTASELLDFIFNETEDTVSGKYLYNSAEEIKNKKEGEATIELYDDNGKLIFANNELNE